MQTSESVHIEGRDPARIGRRDVSWQSVTIYKHRSGGIVFRLGRRQLGHLGQSIVDFPLPWRIPRRVDRGQAGQTAKLFGIRSRPRRGTTSVCADALISCSLDEKCSLSGYRLLHLLSSQTAS